MPDLTSRYQLQKPVADGSETADLRRWVGQNMDLIDAAIGAAQDAADAAGQTASAAQGMADGARQAADAAQETADQALTAANTAQSTASAASSAASAAQDAADAAKTAVTSHVNDAAPHSGHAKIGSANTFTARQTFKAGIQDGGSDTDVSFQQAVRLAIDGRSKHLLYDDNGMLAGYEERSGSTVVYAVAYSRDASGTMTGYTETANGVSKAWSFVRDSDGKITGIVPA